MNASPSRAAVPMVARVRPLRPGSSPGPGTPNACCVMVAGPSGTVDAPGTIASPGYPLANADPPIPAPSCMGSYLRQSLDERPGRDHLPDYGVQGGGRVADRAPRRAVDLDLRARVRGQENFARVEQAEVTLREADFPVDEQGALVQDHAAGRGAGLRAAYRPGADVGLNRDVLLPGHDVGVEQRHAVDVDLRPRGERVGRPRVGRVAQLKAEHGQEPSEARQLHAQR